MQSAVSSFIDNSPPPTHVCQSCGNVLLADETFCRRCGAKRGGLVKDNLTEYYSIGTTPLPGTESLSMTSMTDMLKAGTRRVQVQAPATVSTTVGYDTNHDGRANLFVSSLDQTEAIKTTVGQTTPTIVGQTTPPMFYGTTRYLSPPHSPAPVGRALQTTVQAPPAASYVASPPASYVIPASVSVNALPTTTIWPVGGQMPSMGVVTQTVTTDSCTANSGSQFETITPQVATWIESKIGQAIKQLAAGELSNVIAAARQEAQGAAKSTLLKAEERDAQLKNEVREMWETQTRVLSLFEGISKDAERYFTKNEGTSESLLSVERIISTVDELHRTVENDADDAAAKLRQHQTAIEELRRIQIEEATKQKAALAEIHRIQGESALRQRKNCDELANSIAGTRQEAGDLAQLVQRLETKLSSWRAELTAEVAEEVRAIARERELDAENEKVKIDALNREIKETRLGFSEVQGHLEGFKIELSTVQNGRSEIERRLKESHQTLGNRIESVYSGTVKELESFRQEIDGVSQHINRAEQRANTWRADVSKEIRMASTNQEQEIRELAASIAALRHDMEQVRHEAASSTEKVRHDVQEVASGFGRALSEVTPIVETLRREAAASSASQNELGNCFEKLQVELTTLVATRDAFEFRSKENHEELRKLVDSWMAHFPEEFSALQNRITTDLRTEMRAAIKNEQNTIAAIDEQLWLTDQRLGQRIDELAHAQERTAVMVQVNNDRSVVTRRVDGENDRKVTTRFNNSYDDVRVQASETIVDLGHPSKIIEEIHINSQGVADRRRNMVHTSEGVFASATNSTSALSGEQQLERLRSSRRQLSAGLEKRLVSEESDRHSSLSMAHKAAETLDEFGKGLR